MTKPYGLFSVGLWFGLLILGFPGALFAQTTLDLQVDSLLVNYSHDFEYRPDSEQVSVNFVVEPSVNCTYIQESLDAGIFEIAQPPAFSASLSLVEWNLGTLVSELKVGVFVIPGENVSGRGSGSFFEPCWTGYPSAQGPLALALNLTDVPGLEAFLAAARTNNNPVHARVSLDNEKQIPETDENNNDEDDLFTPPLDLYPLTGNLFYGDAAVSLAASDIARNGCGPGMAMAMDVWGTWQPSTSDSWSLETVAVPAMQCLALAPDGNRFDLAATVPYVVGKMTGTLNGLAVEVDNVILDATGARPGTLTMQLPAGHTLHADDGGGRPEPRGRTSVEFPTVSPANTADFDLLEATDVTGFLHVGSIPLSFRLQSMALTATTLGGQFDDVVYQYDLALEPKDSRQSNGFISNDQRLKKPSSGNTAYSISVSGLATTIGFDAESGRLHFPALGSNWSAFSLTLQDGALVDGGSLSPETYSLSQSADCAGCAGGSPTFFNLTAAAGAIGWDGASIARIEKLGNNPEWGPDDDTKPGRKIFRRLGDQDHPAVVHAPGFHAQGTGGSSDTAVVQYLLGMRAAEWDGQAVNPGAHHGLSSDESRRGNHFMAGVSVGPSLYSSGNSNQVDVGTLGADLSKPGDPNAPASVPQLRIGFGGNPSPEHKDVPSNLGTKYVMRPAGVTGVFNTDSVPQPTVYGYTLPLTRFAIRQVSNRIDEFSWVDGSVQVPGNGDFEIVFESLALECSGDIGKGLVVRETCGDGFGLDVNCSETLGAWSARMEEILAIEFQGSAGVCEPSVRLLNVASVVNIKALEQSVGLTADWKPDGDPANAELTSATKQVFDSPSVDAPGFSAAMNSVTLESQAKVGEQDLGWFEFQGEVGVPFWESLDVEMRFRNTDNGSIQRAQSIVYPNPNQPGNTDFPDHAEMALSVLDQNLEDKPLDAQYEWGGTGWKMEFPVFFETGRYEANKSPRFLGKELSTDLVVMEASAGTDFITPEETQISFGASADFSKLRDLAAVLDLHIDLNDPESIRKIDVFLDDIFDTGLDLNDCGPICQVVGTIRSALNPLNQVVDGGIAAFIEDGIRAAVKVALASVTNLAPDLGAIDALPEEITGRIVDSLRAELVALETPLSDAVNTAILAFYNTDTDVLKDLVAAIKNSPNPTIDATAVKGVQERLQTIISALDLVKTAGNDFQQQGIKQAVAVVEEIRGKKAQIFAPVSGAITQAKSALDGAGRFTTCDSNTNPILGRVSEIKTRIVDVKDKLEKFDLTPVTSLAGVAGVDLSALNQAQQTVRELASDTSARITQLEARINNLCNVSLPDPLVEAKALLTKIDTAVSDLGTKVDSFLDKLDRSPTVQDSYLGKADKELSTAIEKVSVLKSRLESVYEFLQAALEKTSAELAVFESDFLNTANQQGTYPFGQKTGWQDFLDAQVSDADIGTTWSSITADLTLTLTKPIFDQLDAIANEATNLLAPLTAQIPYPTLDELEDQLVALIMNSPVVVAIQDDLYAFTSELTEDLNLIGIAVFDQLNNVIKEVLKAANETINEAFASATSEIPGWELGAGEMDGYALMTGDELSRLHVGAEFALGGEEDGFGFNAALDVTSWSANGKETGCGINPSSGSLLDVVISTYDLPLTLGESEILIDKLYLGFTIQDLAPVGLFGGIFTSGEIGFSEFAIYDPGLALGAGAYENYFGAKAGAKFDSVSMDVAFLVGRTCNQEVIVSLDPQVGEFLTFPDAGFAGLFVRGSARIPVWHNGCFLTVGVGADAGTWILGPAPVTVGMLIGGAIYGEGACIVSVRGQITILAEVSGIDSLNPSALAALIPDNVKLQGEAFFVGGFGLDCDPGTWTNVPRSRKDDWCGTGDLATKATFDGSFHLQTPSFSAIH